MSRATTHQLVATAALIACGCSMLALRAMPVLVCILILLAAASAFACVWVKRGGPLTAAFAWSVVRASAVPLVIGLLDLTCHGVEDFTAAGLVFVYLVLVGLPLVAAECVGIGVGTVFRKPRAADECMACGYSLVGLAPEASCPECRHARTPRA